MSIVDQVIAAVTPSKDEEELDAIELLKKDHDDVDVSTGSVGLGVAMTLRAVG